MNMSAAGYTPILAHVERYRWIERALPWVERMSQSGVLMQVTAGSFFGDYGPHGAGLVDAASPRWSCEPRGIRRA